jgi:hypothetical protein
MRSMRFERLARWAAGALIVLMVHAVGAPRSAEAGCNHLMARGPLKDQGPNRPTHCSGPGCSKQVPVPVPTAVPNSDRSDQWGNVNPPAILPIAYSTSPSIEGPAARPTGEKPSIFHPPPA